MATLTPTGTRPRHAKPVSARPDLAWAYWSW